MLLKIVLISLSLVSRHVCLFVCLFVFLFVCLFASRVFSVTSHILHSIIIFFLFFVVATFQIPSGVGLLSMDWYSSGFGRFV